MEDDFLIKVIYYLVIMAIVITGIIVIISLLYPFIISGVIIFFQGRKFKNQMRNYQLTLKTKFVLFLIGIVSLCISTLTILISEVPNYMVIPFSIIIFLSLSIGTLGLWASFKLAPIKKVIQKLKKDLKILKKKLKEVNKDYFYHNSYKNRLFMQYESQLRDREKLENDLKDLCIKGDNPRVLTALKERIEAEVKNFSLKELEKRLYEDELKEDFYTKLERHVLELEKINRETNNIHLKIEELDTMIELLNREKRDIEGNMNRLLGDIEDYQRGLIEMKNNRIILN